MWVFVVLSSSAPLDDFDVLVSSITVTVAHSLSGKFGVALREACSVVSFTRESLHLAMDVSYCVDVAVPSIDVSGSGPSISCLAMSFTAPFQQGEVCEFCLLLLTGPVYTCLANRDW